MYTLRPISSSFNDILRASGFSFEGQDEAHLVWMDNIKGLESFSTFLATLSEDNCLTEDEVLLNAHLKKTEGLVPDCELEERLSEYRGDDGIPLVEDIAILEETLANYTEQLRRLKVLESALRHDVHNDISYPKTEKSVVRSNLDSALYECKELCESYHSAQVKVAEKWEWFFEEVKFGTSKVLKNPYLFQQSFDELIAAYQIFTDKVVKSIKEWTQPGIGQTILKDALPPSESSVTSSFESNSSDEVVRLVKHNSERIFQRLKTVEMELARANAEAAGFSKAISYFSNLSTEMGKRDFFDLRLELERLSLSAMPIQNECGLEAKCEEFVHNYLLQFEVDWLNEYLETASETLNTYSKFLNVIQAKDHYILALILLLWEERKTLLAAQEVLKEYTYYHDENSRSMKKRMRKLTRLQNKYQFMSDSQSVGKIPKMSDNRVKALMDGSTNLNSGFVKKLNGFMESCDTQQMKLVSKISGIQNKNIKRIEELDSYIKWLTNGPSLYPVLIGHSHLVYLEDLLNQLAKWDIKIINLQHMYNEKMKEWSNPYKKKLDHLWVTNIVSRPTLINDILKLKHDIEIYNQENDLLLKERKTLQW